MSRLSPVRRAIAWGAVAAALASFGVGCTPTCTEACQKVLTCDGLESERVFEEECIASCNAQDAMIESWDDDALREARDEHRRCLGASSCEQIEAGACVQPELDALADG